MKTMTKTNLLKLALTLMATFIFAGTMAQTNNGDGVPGAPAVIFATGGTDGGVFYMVEGTTIPLYALPDPVYHPNWTYGSSWTLTEEFIWTWSVTAGEPANVAFSPGTANEQDNYVEVTINATGSYTISVTETASAAFGECEGAPTTLDFEVVAAPSATLGDLDGVSDNFCSGDAGIPASIIATINGGWRNYRLAWSLEIATLDENQAKFRYYDNETGAGESAVQKYAVNYVEANPQEVEDAGDINIMTVGSFAVINNRPTLYTYTLGSINDQAYRFGDYVDFEGDYGTPVAADFSYISLGETYTIQVNPAPVTGPIYHIPEGWAQ